MPRSEPIRTVRSGAADGDPRRGACWARPRTWPPSRPGASIELLDERADVFGLGAILCEILTGKPPFTGATAQSIRDQAARGELTGALARLESSGADAELIGLARECLAAERSTRPRNAEAVARRVTAYEAGVQERLRAAELARAEAQATAVEERKRHRVTVALAASVLVTAGVLGGGWAYLARQRTGQLLATTRVVSEALAEASRLRGQAQSAAVGDLGRWSEAVDAAKRAQGLLTQGEADVALRDRVALALTELKQRAGRGSTPGRRART